MGILSQHLALLWGGMMQIGVAVASPANLTFFGVWLGAGNEVPILKFESTMIIPSVSPDSSPHHTIQAFWPGLEPSNNQGVFQNVVTNQGGGAGEWYLLPFYCCNPVKSLVPQMRIYPGDELSNTFAINAHTGNWYNNYMVIPSHEGRIAAQEPFAGGFTFDPKIDDENGKMPYTTTLITIELQELGKWNFGPIEWKNIIVQAKTEEIKWCVDGPSLAGGLDFDWSVTQPIPSTKNGVTTCYIAQMLFNAPPPGFLPDSPSPASASATKTSTASSKKATASTTSSTEKEKEHKRETLPNSDSRVRYRGRSANRDANRDWEKQGTRIKRQLPVPSNYFDAKYGGPGQGT